MSKPGQKLVEKRLDKLQGKKHTLFFNNYKQLQKTLKYIIRGGEGGGERD